MDPLFVSVNLTQLLESVLVGQSLRVNVIRKCDDAPTLCTVESELTFGIWTDLVSVRVMGTHCTCNFQHVISILAMMMKGYVCHRYRSHRKCCGPLMVISGDIASHKASGSCCVSLGARALTVTSVHDCEIAGHAYSRCSYRWIYRSYTLTYVRWM